MVTHSTWLGAAALALLVIGAACSSDPINSGPRSGTGGDLGAPSDGGTDLTFDGAAPDADEGDGAVSEDPASDPGGEDATRDVGRDPAEEAGEDAANDLEERDLPGTDSAERDGEGDAPPDVTTECDTLNECGGCAVLPVRRGVLCGPCGSGIWTCDGLNAMQCFGALPSGWFSCGESCCDRSQVCVESACVSTGDCDDDEDCIADTWCDDETGFCVPYGTGSRPDFNPECERTLTVARFGPELQCQWAGPPPGDTYPAWQHVLSTPVVADFDFEDDKFVIEPSIVFTSDDGSDGSSELPTGLIRIIDGRTCEQQFSLEMQWTSHSSPPAVGDLNFDGVPEIVAYKAGGGLVAFTYAPPLGSWSVLWRSHNPDGSPWDVTGGGWGGPAIHDLDGDDTPEVLRGAVVFSSEGELLDSSLGYITSGSSPANMSFVADLDADGRVELAAGDGLWEWNSATTTWDPEAYYNGGGRIRGFVAVADFGVYPQEDIDYPQAPEIAIVTGGQVRVVTLEGDLVFGPVSLPGGGGGPLTIGDFDGDGRAEVACAGRASYTVFDLDCVPGGGTGECGTGGTGGILWTRGSQDFSSSTTGSSIFDFEGDGSAEAIYADECFVRVYDGASGDVIFSQFRSSCTWHENPIVADVDGDFNSELVVPSNLNCGTGGAGRVCEGLEPGAIDPQFIGLHCEVAADCVSGICDAGLCRCATTDDCCAGGCGDSGFVCAAPPGGTPGTGNTCRASHPHGATGIRVYADALDRWVNSRPVWNQHAYFVTNVEVDGTIPPADEAPLNWEITGLNNFRQNIQGDLEVLNAPDATSRTEGLAGPFCETTDGLLTLSAFVCNRGTEDLPPGFRVHFTEGTEDGPVICAETTVENLESGECHPFVCPWEDPPHEAPGTTVFVVPDPLGEHTECAEANNIALFEGVYCLN